MAEIETNQIKELIKKGYDLEIISLELDIPKDTIENLQKEVLEEKEMQDKQKQEEEKNENQEKHEKSSTQKNGNLETLKKQFYHQN